MSCTVHPRATGGEIKTIGLLNRPGQSDDSRYAEWRRNDGCDCDPALLVHANQPSGERTRCGRLGPHAIAEWPTCSFCLREILDVQKGDNMASGPQGPRFRLTPAQMTALTVIEVQQANLVAAANAIVDRSEDRDAAKVLMDAGAAIERAKIDWLQSTQRTIQVASVIPDKLIQTEH